MTLVSLTQEFWIGSRWRPYARLMHCGCLASANGLVALSSQNSVILREMCDNQVNDLRSNYQFFTHVRLYILIVKNSSRSHFLLQLRPPPLWCALCEAYMRESETLHTRVANAVCWCVSQLPFQLQAPDQEAQKNTRYIFIDYYFILWKKFPEFFVYTFYFKVSSLQWN